MKTALITGIAGNLGFHIALHLLNTGYRVLGLDSKSEKWPENTILESEKNLIFEYCDISNPVQVETSIEKLMKRSVSLDLVINNAAIIYNSPLLRFEDGILIKHDFDRWKEVIDVSLSGAFFVSACCAEIMVANGYKGLILNVSSICAEGNIGQPAYSSAKAGLNGLTVALAKELGPLGIRVAAIAPGYLDTDSTYSAVPESYLKEIRNRTPVKKLGSIDEFIQAMDFVIDNSYFNGRILTLDGGLRL